jgi:hypothetical protein
MNLRKHIEASDLEEIQYIVEKNINVILYHHKLNGHRIVSNWEDRISEAALGALANDVIMAHNDVNMLDFSALGITQKMNHIIHRIYPNSTVFPSGFFLYPKTGYMGWHTNSNVDGKRLYITYTDVGGESFFRYKDPTSGKIITDYDDAGLTFREFPVYAKPPYLWHCVGSNCNRFSFGFTIR